MKYTKDEKLDIARRVIGHEFTYAEAAVHFNVSYPTIWKWILDYKRFNGIEVNSKRKEDINSKKDIETLNAMTKEELIDEVIKARIGEERAKKGYKVRGGGQDKEFVSLSSKNIK